MADKSHFLPAFEKGRLDGLVDEGKYLRQSSLYKQILPRTPSWPKTSAISVNPVIMSNFSSCLRAFCAFSWLKNPRILRSPRLNIFVFIRGWSIRNMTYDYEFLRTKLSNFFCKTNPISEKVK